MSHQKDTQITQNKKIRSVTNNGADFFNHFGLPIIFLIFRLIKPKVSGCNSFLCASSNSLFTLFTHEGMYRTIPKSFRLKGVTWYRFNLIANYTFYSHIWYTSTFIFFLYCIVKFSIWIGLAIQNGFQG